jgi:hypothetical protein
VTATKSWGSTLTESMGREVDSQVAAPIETRTPTKHRAKFAHKRVRMEGWRQGRLGSEEDHSTTKGNFKTSLTLTGLLMEGRGKPRLMRVSTVRAFACNIHSMRQPIKTQRLDDLESDFRPLLIACLRECENGRWGLFGQNDSTDGAKYLDWKDGENLKEIALRIRNLRVEFGQPNPLAERFCTIVHVAEPTYRANPS